MIEQGMDAESIVAELERLRGCVHSSFVIETLDFLAAGGRCPQLLAHVGKMISFKPEIIVDNNDGSMRMGKLYRGKLQKVLPRYVSDTLSRYADIICDDLFITHSGIASDLVDIVHDAVLSMLPVKNVHVTQASCTISAHCGPNTLGVLFVTESPSA